MSDSICSEEVIKCEINTITDELKEILEYANQQLDIIKKDTELEEDYLQYDFDIVMIHTRPMLCEQIEIYTFTSWLRLVAGLELTKQTALI